MRYHRILPILTLTSNLDILESSLLRQLLRNFEFMIGLHLGSFTYVLSSLGGGQWARANILSWR